MGVDAKTHIQTTGRAYGIPKEGVRKKLAARGFKTP